MKVLDFNQTQQAWLNLTDILFVPSCVEDYERLVNLLDNLIDEVGEDETHPLASLMEIIGILIERYESENVPELSVF